MTTKYTNAENICMNSWMSEKHHFFFHFSKTFTPNLGRTDMVIVQAHPEILLPYSVENDSRIIIGDNERVYDIVSIKVNHPGELVLKDEEGNLEVFIEMVFYGKDYRFEFRKK